MQIEMVIGRVPWLIVLTMFLIFFISRQIFPQDIIQDSSVVYPDGTQGEEMNFGEGVSDQPVTLANWNQFDGPFSTLKFGGGFLYEYAAYSQDDVSKEQIKMEPDFKVRDFRITMSGKVKVERFITWKLGIMFDGPTSSWFVRETGVMFGFPEISSNFFIGRTKEGFSLNKIMNGYSGWTMERQMAIDVIPILADGIKWMGFLKEQRLLWNIGIFKDWISEKQSFSTYDWQFAARVGWLPFYSESTNMLMHIGLNYRYGEIDGGKIRVRSRPEANPAPYFVDTGEFLSHHSNHLGGEVYLTLGSWMLGSEVYMHQFSSPSEDNPLFVGGDVVVTYLLTGESRPYSDVSSIYSFVHVNKSFFEGGPGAWEILLRYSTLDLDDGNLAGGEFWRITPMINWYMSQNVRLELAYGYGILNRFGLEGATQFYQSRIQLML